MAAATAAYAVQTSPTAWPTRPASSPFSASPMNAGHARRAAELLERVPGAGVAVAGAVEVDAVAAGDEQRHGHRAEQVARDNRYDVLHLGARLVPPHPLPPRQRPRGIVAHGPRPAAARADAGPAFWKLLGTGRGQAMTLSADLRRWALFAVWSDEAALDGFLASSEVAERWSSLAAEAYHVRLEPLRARDPWNGRELFAGASAPPPDGQPVAVLTRATIRPARLVRVLLVDPPAGPAPGLRARPARERRHRRVAARAAGDVLAVALVGRRAGVRVRRRRAPRGHAPHARRALVLRGALRALPALRRDRDVERRRPAHSSTMSTPAIAIAAQLHRNVMTMTRSRRLRRSGAPVFG